MLELTGSKNLQENFESSKWDCRTQIYCFSNSTNLFLHLLKQVFLDAKFELNIS